MIRNAMIFESKDFSEQEGSAGRKSKPDWFMMSLFSLSLFLLFLPAGGAVQDKEPLLSMSLSLLVPIHLLYAAITAIGLG